MVLGVDKSELIAAQQQEASTPVGRTNAPQRTRQQKREARMDAAAGDIVSIVPTQAAQRIVIEDHGDEAYLKIDQRMSWDVALKILDALKRNKPD